MKNLLIFSRRFYPDVYSGTETVIYNLYKLCKKKYNVQLVCGCYNDPKLLPDDAYFVDLSKCRKEFAYWKLSKSTKDKIREFKPDLILANSIEVPSVPSIPTVLIFHDTNFGKVRRNFISAIKESYYRWKSLNVDKIVVVSKTSQKILIKIGVKESKITTIFSGVDTDLFKPTPISSENDFFILSYPSRIIPGKGQHIAIEAIKKLPKNIINKIKLWIVGNSQDRNYLETLRKQSGDLPVSFFTNVPDIVPYYQKADAILFPTLLNEGFGYTAIEGMACGKPIIYSDCPAVMEAVGNLGFVFQKGNSDELCNLIIKLFKDRSKLKTEGKKGRRWVLSQYSWEKTFEKYDQLFQTLLKNCK